MRSLSIVFILAITPMAVTATTLRSVRVPELYKESALVLSGVVESGTILPKDCGVSYTVRVGRRFKGNAATGSLVTFQMYGPMQVGRRYFLFMSKSGEEFEPIMSTTTYSDGVDEHAEYLQCCKDGRPPYAVNVWGHGALKVTVTYNELVKTAVLFDSIVIVPPENPATIKLAPNELYDGNLVEIAAMDLDAFTQYLSEISSDE